jgi:uroporphyrinogen-III synthase
MHLIVTRPRAQAAGWVRELRALGQTASALPLIEITALDDPTPVRQAWLGLGQRALVMFVSANAVMHFFAAAPPGRGWPAGVLAGSTGPGTSAALRSAGVPAPLRVEPAADAPKFDSEALWDRLAGRPWAGRSVLVVRGEDGRDWLAETLRERGAAVDFVAAYRRRPPALTAEEQDLLQRSLANPEGHLWLFSSSEAVGHLRVLAPAADWARSAALASHPRIVQSARAAGFGRVDLVAPRPAAVAAAVAAWPGQVAPIESKFQ